MIGAKGVTIGRLTGGADAATAHLPDGRPRRKWTTDRSVVGLTILIVWGLITHGTFAGSGDEPHYAMIAHSLAFDRDLDLSNNYQEAVLIGGGTLTPEAHAVWRDGRLRPVHDIGMPLLLAPAVSVAYVVADYGGDLLPPAALRATRLNKALLLRHQLSLLMALLTGLLAREIFHLLRHAGMSERGSLGWSLLFAVTPPIVSHSFLFFTEIPTALITAHVLRRLYVGRVTSAASAVAAGALVGLLFLIHARNVGILAGFAVLATVAYARGSLPGASYRAFAMAAGAVVTIRCVITYVLWGSFVTTPHAALGPALSASQAVAEGFVRASGLLVDREHGLLAYAPIYVFACAGLLLRFGRSDPLVRGALIIVVCYLVPVLLPMTNVHGWRGGWTPAARFLVPIAPLLWLFVCWYAQQAGRVGKSILWGAVVFQLAIDAYVWQFPRSLWNDGDGISAFAWTAWLPSWSDAGAGPIFGVSLFAVAAFAYIGAYGRRHAKA